MVKNCHERLFLPKLKIGGYRNTFSYSAFSDFLTVFSFPLSLRVCLFDSSQCLSCNSLTYEGPSPGVLALETYKWDLTLSSAGRSRTPTYHHLTLHFWSLILFRHIFTYTIFKVCLFYFAFLGVL